MRSNIIAAALFASILTACGGTSSLTVATRPTPTPNLYPKQSAQVIQALADAGHSEQICVQTGTPAGNHALAAAGLVTISRGSYGYEAAVPTDTGADYTQSVLGSSQPAYCGGKESVQVVAVHAVPDGTTRFHYVSSASLAPWTRSRAMLTAFPDLAATARPHRCVMTIDGKGIALEDTCHPMVAQYYRMHSVFGGMR